MAIDFKCYPTVTLYDAEGVIIPCVAGPSFNFLEFSYIDLRGYGGDQYTRVSSNQGIINAFSALGYTASIIGCNILVYDLDAPTDNIDVAQDPAIYIVDENGSPIVSGNLIDYTAFDFIDLTAFGGTYTEVNSNQDVINAFASLGINVSIYGYKIFIINGIGNVYPNVRAYLHPTATLIDTDENLVTCSGNTFAYSSFDCVDFSFYGGTKQSIASNTQLRTTLQLLTGNEVEISGCSIIFKLRVSPVEDLEVSEYPKVRMIDTDEGLSPVCTNGVYDYTKFDFIDLSYYGGSSSVRVESNQDVISAFATLGYTVSFSGCDITINTCDDVEDVEVSQDPFVTLVDTDENIVTCAGNNFQYLSFDAVDFSDYDLNGHFPDPTSVEVSSNTELVTKFGELGINVNVENCKIKFPTYPGPYVDLEVCKFKTITIVDKLGAPLCSNNAYNYNLIESIDLSAYGGSNAVLVNSNQDVINAFAALNIVIEFNGCNIKLKKCLNTAPNIVATLVAPFADIEIDFVPEDFGEFDITITAYLNTANPIALSNGDYIHIENDPMNLSVDLLVGGDPTQPGTGFINDVGGNWLSQVIPYVTSFPTLTAAALLNGTYTFKFKKKSWALATNRSYEATTRTSNATDITWRVRARDISNQRNSPVASALMERVVIMLDGFIETSHLFSGNTTLTVFGYPEFNNNVSVSHLIGGTSYPVTSSGYYIANNTQYELFEGNWHPVSPSLRTVDVNIVRENGDQIVSRGFLLDDSDFLVRNSCGANQYPGACNYSPYGENLYSQYPTNYTVGFQCLIEQNDLPGVTPTSGQIIANNVPYPVTFSLISPNGIWQSSTVNIPNLILNTPVEIRFEATASISAMPRTAYLDSLLTPVILY